MTAMLRICFVLVLIAVPVRYVLSETTQLIQQCTSCGPECESSCGSRNFRTCCYNYLKKRSPVPPVPPLTPSSSQQESFLRSKFPWLSALLEGSASSRNLPALASDRDVQVQLFLLPDWPDSLNRYRDYGSNYPERPMGRLAGLSDPLATEAPSASGPNDSAETSGEIGAETNDRGRGQNRRHKPSNWNSRNQRQNENFPWSEVNRHLPAFGA